MVVLSPFLHRELALEQWALATLFSIAGGIYYSLGFLSGRLADGYGARPVVRLGMLVMLVCLLVASLAEDALLFVLMYLVGIGVGVGLCFVPSQIAVQEHAGQHASISAGLATSGIGVGVMVVPAACAFALQYVNWRFALASLAFLSVLGLVGAGTMQRGVVPRKEVSPANKVVRTSRFTLLYLANLGIGLVVFVPMATVVPYVISKGLPGREAAVMLTMVGSGSILGRILFGWMGEYVGARRASVQCAVFLALSFLGLAVKDDLLLLHLAMLLFGLGYGGVFALTAPTTVEVMGMRHFGAVLGALTTSRAVGIALGPTLTALLAEWTTTYATPYLICAGLAMTSAMLLHAEYWTRLPAAPIVVKPDN